MHLKTRTWALISLLCFLGAFIFWRLGEQKSARDEAEQARSKTIAPTNAAALTNTVPRALLSTKTNAASTNLLLKYRLSNTTQNIDQLARNDNAILLRNALIDAKAPLNLAIPPHLRAQGAPGSYVVQARGLLDDKF